QRANGKGLVFALFDPIGITATLNGIRNRKAGELAHYQKQHVRERFVGDTILGLRKSFEDQGDAALWTKKFGSRYDAAKLDSDLIAQQNVTNGYDAQLNVLADDVAKWNGAYREDLRWKDFDEKNDASMCDMQDAFAQCVLGMGKTKAECDLWDTWLLAEPDDLLAPLWKSLAGSAPGLLTTVLGSGLPDIGRMDKITDTLKGAIDVNQDVANLAAKMKEMQSRFAQAHAKFASWRENRALGESQGLIGMAAGAQLMRFAKVHPAEFEKVGYYLMMIMTSTTTIAFDSQTLIVNSVNDLVMKMYRAVRPPTDAPLKVVSAAGQASKRTFVASAEGAVQVIETQVIERRMALGMWLPAEAVESEAVKAVPKAMPLLTEAQKVNPFEKVLDLTRSRLSWVGFVLACLNMTSASMTLANTTAGDSLDARNSVWAGFTSGSLLLLAASFELSVKALEKGFINRFLWMNAKQVTLAGGLLGAFSTAAEGVQMFYKYRDRQSVGNTEAAGDYLSSFMYFSIGAVSSFGGALAAGYAANVFVGALSLLEPVGAVAFALIPVGGWIIAGMLFIGAGCYFAYQAGVETSTPLQDWVAQSHYGTAPSRYLDPAKEMNELRDALYAYSLETDWVAAPFVLGLGQVGPNGFDTVRFTLTLPGASTLSVIRCAISIKSRSSSQIIFNEEVHPTAAFKGGLMDPHMPEMKAMPTGPKKPMTFYWDEVPRLRKTASGSYQYSGVLRVDPWQYTSASIDLLYHPDPADPQFVIPSSGNPVTVTRSAITDISLMPIVM
ncbi:hypothetical protein, partial [Burkholderia sp. 3C]